MRKLIFAIVLLPSIAHGIDIEFLRAWESAQKARPATISAIATIAEASEPGTPLTIRGRVVSRQGSAASGAIVFAWQTDANGVYDRPGAPAHSWRLKGWARTDARGEFTFHTIRPAAYPNGRIPAHVHFSVEAGAGRGRYFADDLLFADDPLLSGSGNAAGASQVTTRNGRQNVAVTLQLDEAQKF